MEKIIQEKISADHLLYVSLKYTKTTQVISNLISRWTSLIENIIVKVLENEKKIKNIPSAPIQKINSMRGLFKNNKIIQDTMDMYLIFRKIDDLEKTRESEFRKNVALTVNYKGKWIRIDLQKLKEYNELLENFLKEIKNKI